MGDVSTRGVSVRLRVWRVGLIGFSRNTSGRPQVVVRVFAAIVHLGYRKDAAQAESQLLK